MVANTVSLVSPMSTHMWMHIEAVYDVGASETVGATGVTSVAPTIGGALPAGVGCAGGAGGALLAERRNRLIFNNKIIN